MDKLTSHVAYDSISYSLDSLSFSGLVAIQDHQPKLPSPNRAKDYQVSTCKQEKHGDKDRVWPENEVFSITMPRMSNH